jgi:hypothetical protein
MTTLSVPRYTGANSFTAQDAAGNVFIAYQSANADIGILTMITPSGAEANITPAPVGGRPSLECIPHVGLWMVGNKETGSTKPPPRYRITQYVPFPAGAPGPQGPQGEPGVGGITLFDAPYVSNEWSGRALAGGQLVDIPATFGVPSAPAYLVRLSGLASAPGVIVRAGTERAPYFVTLVTQVANIRVDTNGWIPGPVALISTVGGSAQTWLQVVGYSG